MESKTKQRLLGLSVCVGLLVILLMFLQSGKDIVGDAETTIVKAPPFPEATTQISDNADDLTAPTATNNTPLKPDAMNVSNDNNNSLVQDHGQEQPKDIISTVRPSIISDVQSTNSQVKRKSTEINNTEKLMDTPISHLTSNEDGVRTALQLVDKKANKTLANPAKKNNVSEALEDDGLFKLQNAAWVIQIGSFKNKTNALRLVNQLRAKGFKAFIQQVSTTIGDSTRVFVGPETKHSVARSVAGQLENEMHIHGIVISYKPLTL